MSRICYLNGDFVVDEAAKISIFDRGFLFADGVYEISLVLGGKLVDNRGHLARFARSLEKIGISQPLSTDEIITIQQQLIEKNGLIDGGIYLQVTRGSTGDRDFLCAEATRPTVLLFPQVSKVRDNPLAEKGISVMSLPDIRWAYRNIKAIGLLGAVLAKQTATSQGFDDAWFIEDGHVTEASSSNAYIVKGNTVITKAANQQILKGITRQTVSRLLAEANFTRDSDFDDVTRFVLVERSFTVEEAQCADEAFVSSAVQLIIPVISIDGVFIGDGKPGRLAKYLRQAYLQMALANRLP